MISSTNMGYVTNGITQTLIEQETEPSRFERFCGDVVSSIEGEVFVLTTSSNYDRGRDGVSIAPSVRVILLCSLRDDVDAKALGDAKSLAKGLGKRRPDAVYFCSSQGFTEKKADEIETSIRTALSLPDGYDRVMALSGIKIAQIASKADGLVERHYPGELANIRKVLADSPTSEEAEHALRLALSTTGADDASTIREGVWAALLRLHLHKRPSTAAALSTSVSNYLRLAGSIASAVLVAHLSPLIERNEVEVDRGVYSLTARGETAFDEDEGRVAKGVLKGRDALISALKAHLKTQLTDDQANAVWHAVQEVLARLFYERGREVLVQISSLLGEESSVRPQSIDLISTLADAAGGAFSHEDQAQEIRTAIRDIIVEGNREAVEWLTRAAYAFVCACAMGLEARTRAVLEQVVGGTGLIFDTDVVLSYLSEDEPAHEAVAAIRDRWRAMGGKILLADEVAAEVSYHAWIAQTDAEHVRPEELTDTLERQILSKNAFVRGFSRMIADKKAKPSQWSRWIGQFRGRSRNDSTITRRTLTKDHNFGILTAPSGKYKSLAAKVQEYLEGDTRKSIGRNSNDHDEFVRQDKAKRDAALFASTVQARRLAEEGHGSGSTFLLTSSPRFARLEKKFSGDDESAVLTIPAVLYLLSMAPDRGLGLTALRGFLFDERWQERVSDFHVMALRLVHASQEFDMPWAKRHTLLRRMDERARQIAIGRSSGRPKDDLVLQKEVVDEWRSPSGKEQMLKELTYALDDVAADRRAETELAMARRKIAELERQLDDERNRNRK